MSAASGARRHRTQGVPSGLARPASARPTVPWGSRFIARRKSASVSPLDSFPSPPSEPLGPGPWAVLVGPLPGRARVWVPVGSGEGGEVPSCCAGCSDLCSHQTDRTLGSGTWLAPSAASGFEPAMEATSLRRVTPTRTRPTRSASTFWKVFAPFLSFYSGPFYFSSFFF